MKLDSFMTANDYRKRLTPLFGAILECPNYQGLCKDHLKPDFRPGPEISFIGSRYGDPGNIRILFTRVAPNWNKKIPDLGSRDSLVLIANHFPNLELDGFYDLIKNYWTDPFTGIRWHGYNLMNTVTGKGNHRIQDVDSFLRSSPRYGITVILVELKRRGLIRGDGDLLDFCAINNLVKCSGKESGGNPTRIMFSQCSRHYLKEVELLEPHLIITFGKDSLPQEIQKRFKRTMLVENLPHPALRPGPWAKQHPAPTGSQWRNEEEKRAYKNCVALRDLVAEMIERVKQKSSP
jgi:hypothetical protein